MAVSKATVHFPCPVEQVWQTVTDLSHTARRSNLARVEVLDETHFMNYTTEFTVTAYEPLRFYAFTMENGNISGSLEDIFEAAEDSARLTCTESVTAKHWWTRPFVLSYLKRQQKLYPNDLWTELLK